MEKLYSGGSNTDHSKTESIQNPNVSKFGFRMVESSVFEWSGPFENRTMASLGRYIYGFKMVESRSVHNLIRKHWKEKNIFSLFFD